MLLWAHALFLPRLALQSGQNHQFVFAKRWVADKTIIDFIKLIHMGTCFEVAKSKTDLAVDIVNFTAIIAIANLEIALYDCYCCWC